MMDIPYDMMNKGGRGYFKNYTPSLHRGGLDVFPGGIFWKNRLIFSEEVDTNDFWTGT